MADPKEVHVDINIIPDSGKPGGVRFEMNSGIGSGGTLIFENDKHPGFNVNFNIVDKDKTGYLFPDDLSEAMWVQPIKNPQDSCPTQSCHWDQFEAKKVKSGNKTLEVRNLNEFQQKFGFTLRFTKDPKQAPTVDFDPIGENRNGPGGGFVNAKSITTTVGGAVVGAVAALLMNEAATAPNIAMGAAVGAVLGFILGRIFGGRIAS